MKQRTLTRIVLDRKNEASLQGIPCDFYIYLKVNGRSYWSNWIKGQKASQLWCVFKRLDKKEFFNKAKSVFIEVGHIRY